MSDPGRHFWNDQRLVAKIAIILTAILTVQAITAWIVWEELQKIQQRQTELAEATVEVKRLRDVRVDIESLQSATSAYLFTRDPAWLDHAERDLTRVDATIGLLLAEDTAHEEGTELLTGIQEWATQVVRPALLDAEQAIGRGDSAQVVTRLARDFTDVTFHDQLLDPLARHIEVDHVQARDEIVVLLEQEISTAQRTLIVALATAALVGIVLVWVLGTSLARRFASLNRAAGRVEAGELDVPVRLTGRDEFGRLARSLDRMRAALLRRRVQDDVESRHKQAILELSRNMQAGADDEVVLQLIMADCGAQAGALYEVTPEDPDELRRTAMQGLDTDARATIRVGDGLAGGVAAAQTPLFTTAPAGYSPLSSGLGTGVPQVVAIVPAVHSGTTIGLLELTALTEFAPDYERTLREAAEMFGLHLAVRAAQRRTEELLEESRAQAEELAAQSAELEESNSELSANATQLEEQQSELQERSAALEEAHAELLHRTEMVDQASAYKSAFLAKMSHELRTPLNSIMILSDRLAGNPDGDLTPKQIEFASTIHACGQDLLHLVNDVLDLSKVEAGRLEIGREDVAVSALVAALERQFRPIAEQAGVALSVAVAPDVPQVFVSDQLRVEQILRNLLSNACKFTDSGTIELRVTGTAEQIRFDVADSGVGIDAAHHERVFEAFAQVDDSRRRAAGGTGLGLAISRELARRMGGDLTVASTPGEGSTFTLTLPVQGSVAAPSTTAPNTAAIPQATPGATPTTSGSPLPASPPTPAQEEEAAGDHEEPGPNDRVLLVIEDDPVFASVLSDVAREHGFVPMVAGTGHEALRMLAHRPPQAITLDLGLPDMDGWVLLDRLRHEASTRYTPIQIISGSDKALTAQGVAGRLRKPTSEQDLSDAMDTLTRLLDDHPRRVGVIGGGHPATERLLEVLRDHPEVELVTAPHPEGLAAGGCDAIVLDVSEPAARRTAIETLEAQPETTATPLIVVDEGIDEDHDRLLERAAAIISADELSEARLVDETARFLGSVGIQVAEEQKELVTTLYNSGAELAGSVILVADDDPRNVFALSTVLEPHDVEVIDAENGQVALDILAERDDIDLILMDVMMPVMDGFEATRRIRSDPNTAGIPVIALTAMATAGTRERCLEAGADDYMSKPLDPARLISLIKVWLDADR